MAKVIKESCDPEAARKLKAAFDLEKQAKEAENKEELDQLDREFVFSSATAKRYGGKAFELVHGNNQAIDQVEHAAEWMPEDRATTKTGFVQSFVCIPPTHVQAFWTYYLLHKEI